MFSLIHTAFFLFFLIFCSHFISLCFITKSLIYSFIWSLITRVTVAVKVSPAWHYGLFPFVSLNFFSYSYSFFFILLISLFLLIFLLWGCSKFETASVTTGPWIGMNDFFDSIIILCVNNYLLNMQEWKKYLPPKLQTPWFQQRSLDSWGDKIWNGPSFTKVSLIALLGCIKQF
jgi:hypothetical protein